MNAPVDIFIAYSHEDIDFKNVLKKFLAPLLREGKVTLWDDFDIEAGQEWDAAIKKRLYSADVVLLLVSSDSLASEYFYGKEVKVSLERHEKGETVVIPVILRHCDWEPTPLGSLEALPEKGRPVVDWPTRDQAFQDVVSKLRQRVEGIHNIRKAASAQADALRDFQATCQAADHLFAKKNWPEARKAYKEALALFLPGFTPDMHGLQQRLQEIDLQEKQVADALRKADDERLEQEKSEQARAAQQQHQAAERLRQEQLAAEFQRENDAWQVALAANTPEAFNEFAAQFPKSRYVREALKNAKALRTANRLPNEGSSSNNRMLFGAVGIVFVLAMAVCLWRYGGRGGTETAVTDTEAIDYEAAKSAGTLLALDSFIKRKYPDEKFEAEAKTDTAALAKRFRALVRDAKQIAEDSPPEAIKHLEAALKIVPNDVEAARLMKALK